jgi:HSP20 family protein
MLTPLAAPWALPDLPALTAPAVNLYEKDGGHIVEFSVPGYTKNDLTIEVSGYILTVIGKIQTEKQNGKKYHFHELSNRSFSRTLNLPVEINSEQVTAAVENGILRIALHR